MPSLIDVGPLTGAIKVRGKDVTTYPLTPEALFYLASKSEVIKLLLDGRAGEIKPDSLMALGPEAIALVVGAGTVNPDYENREEWISQIEASAKIARGLGVNDQLNAIVSIHDMTIPDGIGPFVDALNALTAGMSGAADGSASANKSLNGGIAAAVTDMTQIDLGSHTPPVN